MNNKSFLDLHIIKSIDSYNDTLDVSVCRTSVHPSEILTCSPILMLLV